MKAHVLFSDGTSAELRLELDASPEPKVFVLGSPSRDVLLSAERGANAAYFALRRRGLLRRAYASFFDVVSGAGDGRSVLGESAGLGFALAFAAHALAAEHPGARPVILAATGTVAGGTGPAEVGAVNGIVAKVGGAAGELPAGASIFVPAANDADLPEATRAVVASKGLRLVSVATVDEAVAALASAILDERRGRRWSGLRTVRALAAVVAGVLVASLALRYVAGARGARAALEVRAGTFTALAGGRTLPVWLPVRSAELDALTAEAHRDLALHVSLQSRTGNPIAATEGLREMGGGDEYRVTLAPSRDCHLYAVQVDSSGNLTVLFPNAAFTRETNPVRGGRRYAIPDGDRWLVLDRQPGKETIVVAAAPWPADDLEALLARLPSGGTSSPDLVGAIRERAEVRKAANLVGLQGIAYDEVVFAHR